MAFDPKKYLADSYPDTFDPYKYLEEEKKDTVFDPNKYLNEPLKPAKQTAPLWSPGLQPKMDLSQFEFLDKPPVQTYVNPYNRALELEDEIAAEEAKLKNPALSVARQKAGTVPAMLPLYAYGLTQPQPEKTAATRLNYLYRERENIAKAKQHLLENVGEPELDRQQAYADTYKQYAEAARLKKDTITAKYYEALQKQHEEKLEARKQFLDSRTKEEEKPNPFKAYVQAVYGEEVAQKDLPLTNLKPGTLEDVARAGRQFVQEAEKKVPFVGAIPGIAESSATGQAETKRRYGQKLTPEEQALLNLKAAEALPQRETLAGGATTLALEMPTYMAEFVATGPVYGSVERVLLSSLKTSALAKALKITPKNLAVRLFNNVVAGTAQSAVNVPRMTQKAAEYMNPNREILKTEGNAYTLVDKKGDEFIPAMVRAFGTQAVEYITERLGTYIEEPIDFLKGALLKKWAVKRGITEATEKGVIAKLLKTAQWHNIVGEVAEEEIGNYPQAVIEGRAASYKAPFITPEGNARLLTELTGIAAFGGLSKVSDRTIRAIQNLRTKGTTGKIDLDSEEIRLMSERAEKIVAEREKERARVRMLPPGNIEKLKMLPAGQLSPQQDAAMFAMQKPMAATMLMRPISIPGKTSADANEIFKDFKVKLEDQIKRTQAGLVKTLDPYKKYEAREINQSEKTELITDFILENGEEMRKVAVDIGLGKIKNDAAVEIFRHLYEKTEPKLLAIKAARELVANTGFQFFGSEGGNAVFKDSNSETFTIPFKDISVEALEREAAKRGLTGALDIDSPTVRQNLTEILGTVSETGEYGKAIAKLLTGKPLTTKQMYELRLKYQDYTQKRDTELEFRESLPVNTFYENEAPALAQRAEEELEQITANDLQVGEKFNVLGLNFTVISKDENVIKVREPKNYDLDIPIADDLFITIDSGSYQKTAPQEGPDSAAFTEKPQAPARAPTYAEIDATATQDAPGIILELTAPKEAQAQAPTLQTGQLFEELPVLHPHGKIQPKVAQKEGLEIEQEMDRRENERKKQELIPVSQDEKDVIKNLKVEDVDNVLTIHDEGHKIYVDVNKDHPAYSLLNNYYNTILTKERPNQATQYGMTYSKAQLVKALDILRMHVKKLKGYYDESDGDDPPGVKEASDGYYTRPVIFHAISLFNLIKMLLGGKKIIAPSIGITRSTEALTRFGEVVFIFPQRLVEKLDVYDRDIWSPTLGDLPDVLYEVNTLQLNKVNRVLRKYSTENITEAVHNSFGWEDPAKGVRFVLMNSAEVYNNLDKIAADLGIQPGEGVEDRITTSIFTKVDSTPENKAKWLKTYAKYHAQAGDTVGTQSMAQGRTLAAQKFKIGELPKYQDKLIVNKDDTAKADRETEAYDAMYTALEIAKIKMQGTESIHKGDKRVGTKPAYDHHQIEQIDNILAEIARDHTIDGAIRVFSEYGHTIDKKQALKIIKLVYDHYINFPTDIFEAKSYETYDINQLPLVITKNEQAIKALREAGYTGQIVGEYEKADEFVVREQEAEYKTKGFYSPDLRDTPVFYSKLASIIAAKMPNKISSEDLLKLLKSNGVSELDVKYSNMDEVLKGKETVDKEYVLTALKAYPINRKVVKNIDDPEEANAAPDVFIEQSYLNKDDGDKYYEHKDRIEKSTKDNKLKYDPFGGPEGMPVDSIIKLVYVDGNHKGYIVTTGRATVIDKKNPANNQITTTDYVIYYEGKDVESSIQEDELYVMEVAVNTAQALDKIHEFLNDENGGDGYGREDTPDRGYIEYTLDGGTNYKETVLTTPEREPDAQKVQDIIKDIKAMVKNYRDKEHTDNDTKEKIKRVEEAARYIEERTDHIIDLIERKYGKEDILIYLRNVLGVPALYLYPETTKATLTKVAKLVSETADFHSAHWSPKNALIHYRTKMRRSKDGGDIFFIEELQSDFMNTLRKANRPPSTPEKYVEDSIEIAAKAYEHGIREQELSELRSETIVGLSKLVESRINKLTKDDVIRRVVTDIIEDAILHTYNILQSRADKEKAAYISDRKSPEGKSIEAHVIQLAINKLLQVINDTRRRIEFYDKRKKDDPERETLQVLLTAATETLQEIGMYIEKDNKILIPAKAIRQLPPQEDTSELANNLFVFKDDAKGIARKIMNYTILYAKYEQAQNAYEKENDKLKPVNHLATLMNFQGVKNWIETGVKAILFDAVENGADYIAWTHGAVHQKRWNLLEYGVLKLRYDNGTQTLQALGENDEVKVDKMIPKTELSNYVGGESAKALLSDGAEVVEIDTKDFKETWPIDIYDKIMPNTINDLTKYFGKKTQDIVIEIEGEDQTVHALELTKELDKYIAEEGMPIHGKPLYGKTLVDPKRSAPGFVVAKDTEVFNTRGEKYKLSQDDYYELEFLTDGRVRLIDGQHITVFEGELDRIKGSIIRPLRNDEKEHTNIVKEESRYYEDVPKTGATSKPNLEELEKSHFKTYYAETGDTLNFPNETIQSPADIAYAFRDLHKKTVEHAYLIGIKDGKPVATTLIAKGKVDEAAIDPLNVVDFASKFKLDSIYFVHNHPAGSTEPSPADREMNLKIGDICEVIGIHNNGGIVTDSEFYGIIYPDSTSEQGKSLKKAAKEAPVKDYEQLKEEQTTPGEYIDDTRPLWRDKIHTPDEVAAIAYSLTTTPDRAYVILLNTQMNIEQIVVLEDSQITGKLLFTKIAEANTRKFILVNTKLDLAAAGEVARLSKMANIAFIDEVNIKGEQYTSLRQIHYDYIKNLWTLPGAKYTEGVDRVREEEAKYGEDEIDEYIPGMQLPEKITPYIGRGGLVAPILDFTKWKDKQPPAYSRETIERILEEIAGQDTAKVKSYVLEPLKDNEKARVNWTNKLRQEARDLLDKAGIKVDSREDKLIMLFGEGEIDADALKIAAPKKWAEIMQIADFYRAKYDEILELWNTERARYKYPPVPKRKNYFRHFQEITQVIENIGTVLKSDDLPTEISGATKYFKPGKQFSNAELRRIGKQTDLSAVRGFDNYLENVGNAIFHIDSIQRFRQLEIYARAQAKRQTDKHAKDGAEPLVKLANFMQFINEYTNLLAGKKSMADRGIETFIGRKIYSIIRIAKTRIAKNMIFANIGSALTNFIPFTQFAATTQKQHVIVGLVNALKSALQPDEQKVYIDGQESSFLTRRFGSDRTQLTTGQKVENTLMLVFNMIDRFTSVAVVNGKYSETRAAGASKEVALKVADDYAARVLADRSKGQLPILFSAFLISIPIQFQIEVNNMASFILKDMKKAARDAAFGDDKKVLGKYASMLVQFILYSYIFNNIYEKVVGRRPTIDPLYAGLTVLGLTKDGKDRPLIPRLTKAFWTFASNLPFVNMLNGGRFPLQAGVPDLVKLQQGKTTPYKEFSKPIYSFAFPYAGFQVKKTAEAVGSLAQGGDVLSPSGKTYQYSIDTKSPAQVGQALLFGKYAVPGAREYYDSLERPKGNKIPKSKDLEEVQRQLSIQRQKTRALIKNAQGR